MSDKLRALTAKWREKYEDMPLKQRKGDDWALIYHECADELEAALADSAVKVEGKCGTALNAITSTSEGIRPTASDVYTFDSKALDAALNQPELDVIVLKSGKCVPLEQARAILEAALADSKVDVGCAAEGDWITQLDDLHATLTYHTPPFKDRAEAFGKFLARYRAASAVHVPGEGDSDGR